MPYQKVTRDQIVSYLDTTPGGQSQTWKIIGVGVEEKTVDANPQTTTTKWIINKNATTELNSFQMQSDITQTCYHGDEVYDYVNELRRNMAVGSGVASHVLDIDLYDSEVDNGTTKYKATVYDCAVVWTSYGGGENAEIGYSIYYNGDPKVGTVVITNGTPVFTED